MIMNLYGWLHWAVITVITVTILPQIYTFVNDHLMNWFNCNCLILSNDMAVNTTALKTVDSKQVERVTFIRQ